GFEPGGALYRGRAAGRRSRRGRFSEGVPVTLTRAVLAFLLCFGPQVAHAADLDTVRAALITLRDRAATPAQTLRPEFLTARDELGAWIERRLEGLRSTGEVDGFLAKLNAEIA